MLMTMHRSEPSACTLRRRRRGQAGFTLIEILVVLLLFSVIAAISVPNLRRSRIRAQMVGEVNTLKQAVAVARINAVKSQQQVVLAFSGTIAGTTLPNTVQAWVDLDGDRLLGAGDQLINSWDIHRDITVTMEATEAPLVVNAGAQRGFVFLANGVTLAAAGGGPVGRGVIRLTDRFDNAIRLGVTGGAGTVTTQMAIPGTADWDDNLRHWRY